MVDKITLDSFAAFTKASRSIQEQIKQKLSYYKLNPTEFSVLQVLAEKGQQTVQQISNQVHLTSGSMTYVIDRLQEKGLLTRSDCREDRRVVHVKISDKGALLMKEIVPDYQNFIREMFKEVSQQEQRELISILAKIGENK
ncbi:MarR family winged helix-turn-helix transcriptional regulator [Cytobacillus purgationiresistens]|uniref:MarR family 2-MHQ and catechol resistance regulon transcriptional repressor n=1 Tax=Cytobacillus purgationiresistens TaxID=863449 RepID=A0ABU0ACT3_9BACI|nr:MarR family transcriptional regulator [Cytobacillus purgationiresistens]MDQ0269065.1 MarR family 2-MHQ and catechol resistance regulon transcriptional repressor [Cytobacillus purgationiresistens]